MNGQVLIDTSAWIEYLRDDALRRDRAVAGEVRQLIENDRAAVTEPIFIEIAVGARARKQLERWTRAFSEFRLYSVDREVWHAAAEHGFALGRKGVHVPIVDLLVATIARENGLAVLHGGEKHYPLMAPLMGFTEYCPGGA